MVIYGEYLFLENFITGMIILVLTGKIAGIHLKNRLLLTGGVLCGIYSFVLFWNSLSPWMSLILKIVFSFSITFLVFQTKKIRQLLRVVLIFYIVSFFMGGITIGAVYFLGSAAITQNATVYMDGITYFDIILGCGLTYFSLSMFARFIKRRLNRESNKVEVQVFFGEKSAVLSGMIDTGNFLRDPFTGKPVLIVTAEGAKRLLPPELIEEALREETASVILENLMATRYANRIRMIPYRSIGEERGFMVGIRPDRIHINIQSGKGGNEMISVSDGVVLAIYKGLFSEKDPGVSCSVLLHPSIIEGGVACNG